MFKIIGEIFDAFFTLIEDIMRAFANIIGL